MGSWKSVVGLAMARYGRRVLLILFIPVLAPFLLIAGLCWFCVWLNQVKAYGASRLLPDYVASTHVAMPITFRGP